MSRQRFICSAKRKMVEESAYDLDSRINCSAARGIRLAAGNIAIFGDFQTKIQYAVPGCSV